MSQKTSRHIFYFFGIFIKVQLIYSVVPKYYFFSYYLPSWSIPRDCIQFPIIYSKISLLIHSKCYNLTLLTPDSQSIPLPPPSFLVTASLSSMPVLQRGLYVPYFRFHISVISYGICLSFFFLFSHCTARGSGLSLSNLLHLF